MAKRTLAAVELERWRNGRRQADVAKRIGVTQSCYSAYENGRRAPNRATATKIEVEAGVPVRLWEVVPENQPERTRTRAPSPPKKRARAKRVA
jgi:DNA-binding XRE family transcriptional regulator